MPPVLRHGLVYALIYIGTGVAMPYAPVWFSHMGLTAPQIGIILATPMIGRAVAGPVAAIWADRFKLRRTPMILFGVLAAVSYAALLLLHGFWSWLVLWFVAATALNAISPLADVLTLRQGSLFGFSYAVSRGIGSAAYIVANVLGGVVMARTQPAAAIVWSAVAAGACSIGGLLFLPPEPVHAPGEAPLAATGRSSGTLAMLRDPAMLLLIAAVSLVQGAHAFFYGFSAILWTTNGISVGLVGVLWGVSVAAEVSFFWFCEPLRRRLGPERMIFLGAAASAIRWTCLALSPPLWALFPLQCLHALTFAATFTGSLELVDRLVPRTQASAGQTLVASISFGLATGVATVASGWLFARYGVDAYYAMAAMGGLGCICAWRLIVEMKRRGAVASAH